MGISLGKINYCISELAQKGIIKVKRFKKSTNKSAYMYHLTPFGLEEMTTQTLRFLKTKIREYDLIKTEIKVLLEQIHEIDLELSNDPDLLENLKKIS